MSLAITVSSSVVALHHSHTVPEHHNQLSVSIETKADHHRHYLASVTSTPYCIPDEICA
jgi:hypothetical protein